MTALVGSDATLQALDDLALSVDENARNERLLARRIRRLRAGRAAGRSWRDILAEEPHPGALKLTSQVLGRMTKVSGELRRAIARGLRDQGASVAAIAERFGVSHQRVSALLRRKDR